MKHKLLYLVFLLTLSAACFEPRKATSPVTLFKLSNMYNPQSTYFHPSYTVFHNTSLSSLLLVKIFPSELLYSGTIEPNKLLGKVSIQYQLYDITEPGSSVVADSGEFIQMFPREDADKRYVAQIPFKAQTGKLYQLKILATDMVRKEENLAYLYVDRSSELSEQNFMLLDINNIPFYQPYVVGNSAFKFRYTGPAQYDSIFIGYYGKNPPVPKPPFTQSRDREFMNKPDSLWVFPFSQSQNYLLDYEGTYHVMFDTNQAEGLTLYNFGENYPRVKDNRQLAEPLVYLATSSEYDAIEKSANQKLAVDNFWLDRAKDTEKARELIRVYYNRVYFANYYFTSLKPGWKTDRGMIYIIFGPPQTVNVTSSQEKWIYFKNNFNTTVTFVFNYNPTPFSLNTYILEPSLSFDNYWKSAIEAWRAGRIFLIE
jgi:GWxTD domain-containing protein